jgi:hypothetical protein
MSWDEHCKHLEVLGDQGMAAMESGDEDAALLYVAAIIDYVLRYGDEIRRDAGPVDQAKLAEMKQTFQPIMQAIEERMQAIEARLGPRKTWQ